MENQTEKAIVKKDEVPISQRFMEKVMNECKNFTSGEMLLSEQQKRLVRGYFICIDRALNVAETNRLKKGGKGNPYTWEYVDMTGLALDAAHYARIGLDMQEKNHLFPIPYANRKTGKYDITFTVGYSGIQYIAEKYAISPPRSVTVEVVYSNDVFKPLKKSRTNPVETYEFEISNPFDRGSIIGGFGYIEYDDASKNTLVIMNMDAIKKRAGKNANPEFWSTAFTGKKTTAWENDQKVYVDADGWLDEMVRKTLIREVYSSKYIARDPSKIDDDYQHLKEREVVYAQAEIDAEATENANSTPLSIQQKEEQPPAPVEETQSEETAPTEKKTGGKEVPDF